MYVCLYVYVRRLGGEGVYSIGHLNTVKRGAHFVGELTCCVTANFGFILL